jgi:hypothetical protein
MGKESGGCVLHFYQIKFKNYKAPALQGLYLYGKQESASNLIHYVWVIEVISF